METATTIKKSLKGGEWLIKESAPADVFIPEDFNEEQLMIKDLANNSLIPRFGLY